MSNNFQRIAESLPIDRTAANVTSGGTRYESKKKITIARWDSPPPIRQIPYDSRKNLPDYTGKKWGRLTVIGLHASRAGANGFRWVVRCACGMYEVRRTETVRKAVNADECCAQCAHLKFIQRRALHLKKLPKETSV